MIKKFAILALAATFLSACTTTDPYTGEQKMSNMAGGAGIGAVAGALGGLAVGGGSGKSGRNAILLAVWLATTWTTRKQNCVSSFREPAFR